MKTIISAYKFFPTVGNYIREFTADGVMLGNYRVSSQTGVTLIRRETSMWQISGLDGIAKLSSSAGMLLMNYPTNVSLIVSNRQSILRQCLWSDHSMTWWWFHCTTFSYLFRSLLVGYRCSGLYVCGVLLWVCCHCGLISFWGAAADWMIWLDTLAENRLPVAFKALAIRLTLVG